MGFYSNKRRSYKRSLETVSEYEASLNLESNISILESNISNKASVTGSTSAASNVKGLRNITISNADPSGGSDGDVWLKY